MIKAIIFDWFGVCTVENWSTCFARKLQAKLGLDEALIISKFREIDQSFARAELNSEQFLKKFITSLDKDLNPQDFYYIFNTIPDLNEELFEFIVKLKKYYKIFLVSNNFGPVFPNYEKKINFNEYFDALFLSHELKASKTQEKIWKVVLSKLEYSPAEILFIDNRERYCEQANKVGISTVLFKNNEQLKRDLSLKLSFNLK